MPFIGYSLMGIILVNILLLPIILLENASILVFAAKNSNPLKLSGSNIRGACVFGDFIEGTEAQFCKEYRLDAFEDWSYYDIISDCGKEYNSTYKRKKSCISFLPESLPFAGYCVKRTKGKLLSIPMMITEREDCAYKKMLCEDFFSGSFDPLISTGNCEPFASIVLDEPKLPTSTGSSINNNYAEIASEDSTGCIDSLSSTAVIDCPSFPSMIVSFGGIKVDCSDKVPLELASIPPVVKVRSGVIGDPDGFYSLLLVDTTTIANSYNASNTHPILHYGAVNIPGHSLEDGFSLFNTIGTEADVFWPYRGPNPPRPSDPWAPPDVDRIPFVYEFMIQKQDKGQLVGADVQKRLETNTNFDYESFFGSGSNTSGLEDLLISSTTFWSGWCVVNKVGNLKVKKDILMESFEDPKFEWTEVGRKSGSKMEIVDGVMVLTANGSSYEAYDDVKFDSNMTSIYDDEILVSDDKSSLISLMPSVISTVSARGDFPDLSKCDGLKMVVKSETPMGDESMNNVYSIGLAFQQRHGEPSFAFTYGASLAWPSSLTVSSERSIEKTKFSELIIPFKEFTLDWDWNTGKELSSCSENATNCLDQTTLQNMENLTITTSLSNATDGYSELQIHSIYAIGCESTLGNDDAQNDGDRTCSNWNSSFPPVMDEIPIESFLDPTYDWMTVNDPIMGGESYSSMSLEDGAAVFSGEVKDVPFLGVPGFIKMEANGGRYPDVSCCDSIKLTVMTDGDYDGYYFGFGSTFAYKAELNISLVGEYVDVIIPFDAFSVEWYEGTSITKIRVTCADDPSFCQQTLKNMESLSIWGEGVEGSINLKTKSISAVGCSPADVKGLDDTGLSSVSSRVKFQILPTTVLAMTCLLFPLLF